MLRRAVCRFQFAGRHEWCPRVCSASRPAGTIEISPAIYRWVNVGLDPRMEVPQGRLMVLPRTGSQIAVDQPSLRDWFFRGGLPKTRRLLLSLIACFIAGLHSACPSRTTCRIPGWICLNVVKPGGWRRSAIDPAGPFAGAGGPTRPRRGRMKLLPASKHQIARFEQRSFQNRLIA
jgi:hypothetical protein